MTKMRFVCGLLALALCFSLPALASDEFSYGTRITGRCDLSSTTATSARMTGDTYVGTYWDTPSSIEVDLDLFKGGVHVGLHVANVLSDATYVPGSNSVSNVNTAGAWQAVTWHYAVWSAEPYSDSTTTYDPVLSGSAGTASVAAEPSDTFTNEALAAYAGASQDLQAWTRVSFERSSADLKSLLTHENAVALDKLFHSDLSDLLRDGDRMPGLLLSPEGDHSIILFFHGDGSVTRVEASLTATGIWEVTSNVTEAK